MTFPLAARGLFGFNLCVDGFREFCTATLNWDKIKMAKLIQTNGQNFADKGLVRSINFYSTTGLSVL